jgi:hypothetical protein
MPDRRNSAQGPQLVFRAVESLPVLKTRFITASEKIEVLFLMAPYLWLQRQHICPQLHLPSQFETTEGKLRVRIVIKL